MKVIFCRHAETIANKRGVFIGLSDSPLTKAGVREARLVAKKLQNKNISIIYASPSDRAVKTAKIFSQVLGVPVVTNDLLREICYGGIDGMSKSSVKDSIKKERSADLYNYIHPGKYKGVRGESYSSAMPRVRKFIKSVEKTDGNAVAVTHAGFMKNVLILKGGDPKTVMKKKLGHAKTITVGA